MTTRLSHDQRRHLILAAAVEIANRNGLITASMSRVAQECSVRTSDATIRSYFRTKGELWRAIADHPKASRDVKRSAETMGLA